MTSNERIGQLVEQLDAERRRIEEMTERLDRGRFTTSASFHIRPHQSFQVEAPERLDIMGRPYTALRLDIGEDEELCFRPDCELVFFMTREQLVALHKQIGEAVEAHVKEH